MNISHETPPRGHDNGEASQLITTRDLARRLGVSSNTIRKWVRQGRIPCIRVGQKTLRFDAVAVMDSLRKGGDV
ncbi:MAG TPA: DNA-binding protein [Phycisphaerales bacterium]|nr:DNA-binding protein [Phycisphaerales bacterium]